MNALNALRYAAFAHRDVLVSNTIDDGSGGQKVVRSFDQTLRRYVLCSYPDSVRKLL